MYDTIKGRLQIEKIPLTDRNRLLKVLENVSYIQNKFGNCHKGNIKELIVKISENFLYVEGSLTKFIHGNNLESISRRDTMLVIEELKDIFKVNLDEMNMTRIDVAMNVIVKYPEELYYTRLGELNHFKRIPVDKGLYYNGTNQQLLFYGKLREYKDNKIAIPTHLSEMYILRYEYRIKQRLPKVLNRKEVVLVNLYDEDFYNQLIQLWHNSYKSINKINDINIPPTKSAKQFKKKHDGSLDCSLWARKMHSNDKRLANTKRYR